MPKYRDAHELLKRHVLDAVAEELRLLVEKEKCRKLSNKEQKRMRELESILNIHHGN
jgi:hypothetical protein